jgi:hypothetical protein
VLRAGHQHKNGYGQSHNGGFDIFHIFQFFPPPSPAVSVRRSLGVGVSFKVFLYFPE